MKPHLKEIETLINDPVEPLKPKIAYEVICQKYGLTVGYTTFKRFVRVHFAELFPKSITCRIEGAPGEEGQIDYGYMGLLAEHYGCFIDPCRVRQARDKEKVDRSVPAVPQLFRKLKKLYPNDEKQIDRAKSAACLPADRALCPRCQLLHQTLKPERRPLWTCKLSSTPSFAASNSQGCWPRP
ncbi:MAG: hypothetical protein ACE5OR_02690 [bacterium]